MGKRTRKKKKRRRRREKLGEGMVDGKVGRGKEGNEEDVNVRNGEDQL